MQSVGGSQEPSYSCIFFCSIETKDLMPRIDVESMTSLELFFSHRSSSYSFKICLDTEFPAQLPSFVTTVKSESRLRSKSKKYETLGKDLGITVGMTAEEMTMVILQQIGEHLEWGENNEK